MSSSNLKRSGKAPKPSDGHRESVPSEVANSGLMETNGDQLFLKAPTNGTQVGSGGRKGTEYRAVIRLARSG